MLVLDTDHMSLLEWGGEDSAALRERLADIPPDQAATTIISYEEQVRGWMAYYRSGEIDDAAIGCLPAAAAASGELPANPGFGF